MGLRIHQFDHWLSGCFSTLRISKGVRFWAISSLVSCRLSVLTYPLSMCFRAYSCQRFGTYRSFGVHGLLLFCFCAESAPGVGQGSRGCRWRWKNGSRTVPIAGGADSPLFGCSSGACRRFIWFYRLESLDRQSLEWFVHSSPTRLSLLSDRTAFVRKKRTTGIPPHVPCIESRHGPCHLVHTLFTYSSL